MSFRAAKKIFLSASSARGDDGGISTCISRSRRFLSASSAREDDLRSGWYAYIVEDFYPRPPRGRTTTAHRICTLGGSISIRVLREGGRPEARTAPPEEGKFLSASSAREDDLVRIKHIQHRGDFYPRPPRGRTTFFTLQLDFLIAISIRVLREGGRRSARSTAVPACGIFLSASSAREDDEAEREAQRRDRRISIRVLREGGRQHSTDKPFEVNIISLRVLREGGRPSFSTYTSP